MRILIFSFFVLFLCSCISGAVVITGEERPPTDPTGVKIYFSRPDKAESIGLVRSSGIAGFAQQQDYDNALNELKEQAAKIGANGIVLNQIVVTGKAIWIDEQPK